MRRPAVPRRGALAVEASVVYPVLFFLLFALLVGGIGVFRYQQVALLAREAGRRAAVRGADWQKQTGNPAITAEQLRSEVVLPMAAGMEPEAVTLAVHWINRATGEVVDWDSSPKKPTSLNDRGEPITNRVRVTVTYRWGPGLLVTDPLTLRSVCEIPMAY